MAVSLLMEGEDVEFWQKLSKNTKSNADDKAYKTSGCHNELHFRADTCFLYFYCQTIAKTAYDY